MKKQDWNKIILETFQLIYEVSTPPANFQLLLDEAELDMSGRKIIPYNDYYISNELLDKIIEEQIIKYKIDKYRASSFRTEIYLGPSPSCSKIS